MRSFRSTSYISAAVLWTAVVFYACLAPSDDVPSVPWLAFPGADKLIHMVLFAILCGLYWKAYSSGMKNPVAGRAFIIAAICAGIGVVIEILQASMLLGRSFEVWDIVADTGASLVVSIGIYFRHKHTG